MEAGLPARAKELREAADRLGSDPGAADAIRRLAHRLRGVAGTHGQAELGERAAALEAQARDATDLGALAEGTRTLADAIDRVGSSPHPGARPPRPVAALGPKRLANKTVVALDDDDATRRLLELTLGPVGGASTHVVETAAALYAIVRSERVDLVVVDAMMPETTGLDVILALRAEHGERAPRFAVLSAATATELDWVIDPALDVTWLRKPFRPSELVEQIARTLGR